MNRFEYEKLDVYQAAAILDAYRRLDFVDTERCAAACKLLLRSHADPDAASCPGVGLGQGHGLGLGVNVNIDQSTQYA